jgi:hypothetical protein
MQWPTVETAEMLKNPAKVAQDAKVIEAAATALRSSVTVIDTPDNEARKRGLILAYLESMVPT